MPHVLPVGIKQLSAGGDKEYRIILSQVFGFFENINLFFYRNRLNSIFSMVRFIFYNLFQLVHALIYFVLCTVCLVLLLYSCGAHCGQWFSYVFQFPFSALMLLVWSFDL